MNSRKTRKIMYQPPLKKKIHLSAVGAYLDSCLTKNKLLYLIKSIIQIHILNVHLIELSSMFK